MLEMLLCLTPVMVMFMAVTQAAFLSVAHLVVRHAAQRGARTAIVVLEEDPKYFGDSPRGHLGLPVASHGASPGLPDVSTLSEHFDKIMRALIDREPSRINAIRTAVYLPMALIGPGGMAKGLLYNLAATAVTFPQAPKSEKARQGDYGPTDEITVRVTYLFKCEMPIASAFMCDKLYELDTGIPINDALDAWSSLLGGDVDAAARQAQRALQVQKRLKRQEPAMRELENVELPDAQMLLMLGGGRFTTIQSEVTMPIQGAKYYARHP
jgi:hypothetical protein